MSISCIFHDFFRYLKLHHQMKEVNHLMILEHTAPDLHSCLGLMLTTTATSASTRELCTSWWHILGRPLPLTRPLKMPLPKFTPGSSGSFWTQSHPFLVNPEINILYYKLRCSISLASLCVEEPPSGQSVKVCLAGPANPGFRDPLEKEETPLQYSSLGNPMARETWWLQVHWSQESDMG